MNCWQSLRQLISIFRVRGVVVACDLPFGEVRKGFSPALEFWTMVVRDLVKGLGFWAQKAGVSG
jgi:hypothetical protein